MGDRRNIVCEFPQASVAFYTHWAGTEAPGDLKTALMRGRSRWSDPAYLARIIFCAMVEADIQGQTGFGIEAILPGSDAYCEASPRDLVVDLAGQLISQGSKSWTFEEFTKLDEDQLLEI
jgi:hypothetical protein